jgi:hypothetical protein
MNLLFFTHAPPQYLPEVFLDPAETVAGPHYRNWRRDGHWKYLNAPSGAFDASSWLRDHLPNQMPDGIVVHADATLGCLPMNLPEACLRILLVGDTHHLQRPLQNLVAYAQKARFDAVILWNRQHAHFFLQAGIMQVFWMPGLVFSVPSCRRSQHPLHPLCFFGQLGNYHPRRKQLIEHLRSCEILPVGGHMPRRDSLELAAQSQVSLNISLNGEFNLRVFESTAAGAMLLTDRTSPQAGLHHFYENGDSMMEFDDAGDLVARIRMVSQEPGMAAAIAAKGKAVTEQHFSLPARRDAFWGLIRAGEAPEAFRLSDEPRCSLPVVEPGHIDSLVFRLQLYEFLQEQHRCHESVRLAATGGIHPLLLSDACDLVRLRQELYLPGQEFETVWEKALRELGVTNLEPRHPDALQGSSASILVTTLADLELESVQACVVAKQYPVIILSDWYASSDPRYEDAMRSFGYAAGHGTVPGLFLAT